MLININNHSFFNCIFIELFFSIKKQPLIINGIPLIIVKRDKFE